MKVLWWIKQDMRLFDNEVLVQARSSASKLLPVYFFEPSVIHGPDASVMHAQGKRQGLISLRKNLQYFGSDICILHDEIIPSLEKIKKEYAFDIIFSQEEIGLNHTFDRDKQVRIWCRDNNIRWIEVPYPGVQRGRSHIRDGYSERFQKYLNGSLLGIPVLRGALPKISLLNNTIPTLIELGYENSPEHIRSVGERSAQEVLDDFLSRRIHQYSGGISSMNSADTACSRLSIQLAYGTISLRAIMHASDVCYQEVRNNSGKDAQQIKKSLRSFTSRLFWHSHFIQKLESEVVMEFHSQNKAYDDSLPVVSGEELNQRLLAWKQGLTGFPYIDACIRYYNRYGWLNFRGRAMITSFAIHGLRIPWNIIMYELAKKMSDYIPGIHVPQIHMQAGLTGINTLRVYSPDKQMHEQDPHAVFIRSWVPELSGYEAEEIFMHSLETPLPGYIIPIIDFKKESKIYKDAWYTIKKTDFAKTESRRVYAKHGSRKRQKKKT